METRRRPRPDEVGKGSCLALVDLLDPGPVAGRMDDDVAEQDAGPIFTQGDFIARKVLHPDSTDQTFVHEDQPLVCGYEGG
jgi:hypothetical protein